MTLTDRELLALQAETLYTHDGAGRLRHINEQPLRPAARVFIGRARDGLVCRWRYDVPDPLVQAIAQLVATTPHHPDLADPATTTVHLNALRGILERQAPVEAVWHGPAYVFPNAPQTRPDGVARITAANRDLLQTGFPGLVPWLAESEPCVAVIHDGAAVAVCFSSRTSARAAEAGVETLPAFRGRGYATRAVTGWAAAVREQGRLPLYSTSWDNLASQGVAKRVGLRLYGVDLSLT